MINYILLKEKIKGSGLKLEYISKRLGLTRYGLSKKLSGDNEFKTSEMNAIGEVLGLSRDEKVEIFFNDNVDRTSTL